MKIEDGFTEAACGRKGDAKQKSLSSRQLDVVPPGTQDLSVCVTLNRLTILLRMAASHGTAQRYEDEKHGYTSESIASNMRVLGV